MAELTGFSAAQGEALARWLDHLSAVKGASDKTITAYRRDVQGFLAFMSAHHEGGAGLSALDALPHTDLRAWMAAERGRGLQARSLSRALSAVKNFLGWLAERQEFDATVVLSTRGPRYRRKLPRPLTVEGARDVVQEIGAHAAQDWVGARDIAVATLLYACGLRISEALGLTGAALDGLIEQIPAGRRGKPAEIAEAVVFLASDEGGFTVGSEFVIDGGMSNL
jgi:integrase/recombinase XerC